MALTRAGTPLDSVAQLALWEPTGLTLPPDLPFADWQAIGSVIGHMEKGVMWWLGDWRLYGERYYGSLADQADAAGVPYQTLANAAFVAKAIPVSRRRETLSQSHHAEVAALPPEQQDDWLDRATEEAWSRNDLRSALRRERVSVEERVVLPPGKYNVLLADPPWRYDFVEADNRAIENQYPTLAADEIASFTDAAGRNVGDLAADEAVLFLWATNPKLTEALSVISGWGFTYLTNLVWVKDRIGMGYWARSRHELLLIAKRGEMSPPAEADRPDSVIEAPRMAHSAKPDSVYELIETLWPTGSWVEVFARSTRPGWASFGNQVVG